MAKYVAHGTTVSINSKLIGGLTSITIPERTRGEAEITDSDSSDREFLAGLRDPGSMKITFRHDPTDQGQQELDSNYNAAQGSEVVQFVITLPVGAGSGHTYTFDGYVSQPPTGDFNLVDDQAAELTATIRVSGAVTIV
jgi:hypothetical protein